MTIEARYLRTCAGVAGLALAVTGLAACGGSDEKTSAAAGNKIGTSVQEVCELGAKEGEVDLRRGSDLDLFAKEIGPFKAKYPDIKVNYVSMKPQDNVQRILASIQTKKKLDVDGTDFDLPSADPLFQAGAVADVDWKSLGIPDDRVIKYGPVNLARSNLGLGGLVYDTKKTDPASLPNTWDELVNAKWAGKFIVDTRGKQLSPLSVVWGEQKAIDWYKSLIKTAKPVGVQGATASIQKVTSGEAVFTTSGHNNEVDQTNAEGGSVAIKYLDIIPAFTEYTYILKDAPHPNAIRCLYAWRLGAEGAAEIKKVEFKTNEIDSSKIPATSKIASDQTEEQGQTNAKVAGEFADLTK